MPLTRKLTDLFVVGKDVVIEDGKGEPVSLYIRKITPVDAEEAYRAANAARAQALAAKTDPQDPLFMIVTQQVESATKDLMVEILAATEVAQKRLIIEAELEAAEKWSKDDYLQGLHDAWESGLKEKHFTDPDDETKRVKAEMEKFSKELEKRLERELVAAKKDLEDLTHQQVADRFFDIQFEREAETRWLAEFRRQELYFAVRDPDNHDEKAFESAKDVERVMPDLIRKLREEYASLTIDTVEGKD